MDEKGTNKNFSESSNSTATSVIETRSSQVYNNEIPNKIKTSPKTSKPANDHDLETGMVKAGCSKSWFLMLIVLIAITFSLTIMVLRNAIVKIENSQNFIGEEHEAYFDLNEKSPNNTVTIDGSQSHTKLYSFLIAALIFTIICFILFICFIFSIPLSFRHLKSFQRLMIFMNHYGRVVSSYKHYYPSMIDRFMIKVSYDSNEKRDESECSLLSVWHIPANEDEIARKKKCKTVYTFTDTNDSIDEYLIKIFSSSNNFNQTKSKSKLELSLSYEKSSNTNFSSHSMVVLYAHGQGGTVAAALRVALYRRLSNDAHMQVVAFDYGGFGDSTLRKPTAESVTQDLLTVLEWIIKKGNVSPKRIIIWAHSLGTAITLRMLSTLPDALYPLALVLESPFTSIEDMIHASPFTYLFKRLPWFHYCFIDPLINSKSTNNFDSIATLSHIRCPIMILHAEDDLCVPFSMGKKMYEKVLQLQPPQYATMACFHAFEAKFGYNHNKIHLDPTLPNKFLAFVENCHIVENLKHTTQKTA